MTSTAVAHDVWKLLPGLKPGRSLLAPEVCRGDAGELWARMMISDDMRHDPLCAELEALREAYGAWLLLSDGEHRYDQLDVALAVIVANRFESSPLWLMLVSPPSTAKTQTIEVCSQVDDTHLLSDLTPQTLASGWDREGEDGESEDASLLPKLKDKTVLFKDFTSILTGQRDARNKIFAQLREIYDGAFYKAWGTGKELNWRGKIGVLAGVTPIIDEQFAFNSQLGERFILYRIPAVNRKRQSRRALDQQMMGEDATRERLRWAATKYLRNFPRPQPMAPLSEVISVGIGALADYVAIARTGAHFSAYGEMTVSEPEGPARLTKQFGLVIRALALVRCVPINESTFRVLTQVAYDTIPPVRQKLLALVIKHGEVTVRDAAKVAKLSDSMTENHLKALARLELLEELGGRATRWTRSVLLRELMMDIEQAGKTDPAVTEV